MQTMMQEKNIRIKFLNNYHARFYAAYLETKAAATEIVVCGNNTTNLYCVLSDKQDWDVSAVYGELIQARLDCRIEVLWEDDFVEVFHVTTKGKNKNC